MEGYFAAAKRERARKRARTKTPLARQHTPVAVSEEADDHDLASMVISVNRDPKGASGGTWQCCIWESASRGPKWCLEDDGKKASHLAALSPRSYLGHWILPGCMASLFAGGLCYDLPSRTIKRGRNWNGERRKRHPSMDGRTSREEAKKMEIE
ncbi:hypothetical protein B0T18DRAFT_394418 [Schizothecium vesticola]|uniref:Uncharacterized protein n=1 Tax=Schizothecium vesticola TaxID=314040 RepID=A0AA40BPJ6_9PEZI|nr:hypothetical protein B0T18DRAFT_394418 [Schizothecium vesticola]